MIQSHTHTHTHLLPHLWQQLILHSVSNGQFGKCDTPTHDDHPLTLVRALDEIEHHVHELVPHSRVRVLGQYHQEDGDELLWGWQVVEHR